MPEEEPEPLVALAHRRLGPLAVRQVDPLDEDARHGSVDVPERLVDELEEPFLGRPAGFPLDQDPHVRADERLAGPIHAIQQLEETLALDLRQGFADRLADDVPAPDELIIAVVRELEDMPRPPEDRQERGRAAEHLGQPRSASTASWSRRRSASARRRSVMSRAILNAPMTRPSSSRTGETVREISTCRPPLATRTVSKCSTRSPRRSRSRIARSSSCRSGGMIRMIDRPTASAAV